MKQLNSNTFVLCCRGKKCPVVTIEENDVFISDDYNNKVKMTKEQFFEMEKVFNTIKNDKSA